MTVTQFQPQEADNDKKIPENDVKRIIIWKHVIFFGLAHAAAIYAIHLALREATWPTAIYTFFAVITSGLGVTAGAHRLWAHRSYKARLPLQILLLYLQTMAIQYSMIWWVREHRMHHKYAETDGDPHNANRGFFFSHIGWLLVKKDPSIKAKGYSVEMSDITENPLLRFQYKYYLPLVILSGIVIPTYIPTLWGEPLWNSFFYNILRYVISLHMAFLVNSAAHLWGQSKPYDNNIKAVEIKTLATLVLGEGFHNFHHTFPCDYKTSELGNYPMNLSALFIDMMAKIGWAYDLKTVSNDVIQNRAQRTGDGSHKEY